MKAILDAINEARLLEAANCEPWSETLDVIRFAYDLAYPEGGVDRLALSDEVLLRIKLANFAKVIEEVGK